MKPICKTEADWDHWRAEISHPNIDKFSKKQMNKAIRRHFKRETNDFIKNYQGLNGFIEEE